MIYWNEYLAPAQVLAGATPKLPLMRCTHLSDTFFPLHEQTLPDLAVHATQRTSGVESEHALVPIRQLRPHVLAQRQEVVFLLTDEGAHEEEQNHGALARLFPVGTSGMPQAAFENQGRSSRSFGRNRAVDSENIGRGNLTDVRPRVDTCSAILLRDVFEVEHDVHTEGHITDWRLHGDLVGVQLHWHVARARNVGSVCGDDGVLAEEPRDHLIDDGVVEEVQEVLSLVDQSPESLVRPCSSTIHLRNASFALACSLLLHGLLHDGDLLWGQDVFGLFVQVSFVFDSEVYVDPVKKHRVTYQSITKLLDIPPDLLDILRWLRQPAERISKLGWYGWLRGQQVGKFDGH